MIAKIWDQLADPTFLSKFGFSRLNPNFDKKLGSTGSNPNFVCLPYLAQFVFTFFLEFSRLNPTFFPDFSQGPQTPEQQPESLSDFRKQNKILFDLKKLVPKYPETKFGACLKNEPQPGDGRGGGVG